jgi:hypothetical protein
MRRKPITWNLDSYYISDDLWETDYHTGERQLPALAACERRMTESAEAMVAALTLHDMINTVLEKWIWQQPSQSSERSKSTPAWSSNSKR